ncbi:TlpA family protein disulfide reductase [Pseudokineococcus sp. 1T1Z-3]|uniref:TlpA family protein disulfide reductase n=1 Tax=Pseudokineococcus sp. 1T1Z-3 TaxID=3132745 RepID=UPI0030A165DF
MRRAERGGQDGGLVRPRPHLVGTVVALVALLVAGCSTSDGQQVVGQGYVSGDGSLVQLAPEDRGDPVELVGTTLDGEQVDVTDWRGAPVVLNTWYAACGPCRVEAPTLVEVATETAADGVHFLGLNTSDGAAQGLAFEEEFGVPYPSLEDRDGEGVLALRGQLPPAATPTTLVLDPQGRVAARFSGAITEPSILRSVIDDAAEGA